MEERRFINGTGRRGLIFVALLLFILAGSGVAYAATVPGESVQVNLVNSEPSSADTGDARQTVLGEPADSVAYRDSGSAFSLFYNPMPLACGLGTVLVLSVGYYLIRRSRKKDAP